jgi:hypothetical protein
MAIPATAVAPERKALLLNEQYDLPLLYASGVVNTAHIVVLLARQDPSADRHGPAFDGVLENLGKLMRNALETQYACKMVEGVPKELDESLSDNDRGKIRALYKGTVDGFAKQMRALGKRAEKVKGLAESHHGDLGGILKAMDGLIEKANEGIKRFRDGLMRVRDEVEKCGHSPALDSLLRGWARNLEPPPGIYN